MSKAAKEGEKAPRFGHSFAQSVLDGVADSVMVIDVDYRVIAMNRTARLEYFGGGPLPDEVLCYRATHHREEPCSGDDHPCPLREALRTRRPVTAIHNHLKPDGTEAVSEIIASPLFDEKDVFMYVVETNRDVTDRMRAEKALKESEAQLRTVMDSINAGVMLIDAETHIVTDVNFSAGELIGKSREHIVGSICHGYICPAETGKCPITDLKQTMNLSERRLINSRGEYVPILKSVAPVKMKDRMFLIESFVDITELKILEEALKDREEKLRTLTNTAQDAIVVMDNEGKISFWNPAAEKIFGYSRSEAIGKELHTFLGPQKYYESYREGFEDFKETGKGPAVGKTLELRALRKGGEEFPIELSLSSIQIMGKWHAVGIIRDITERKKAEEEIRKLNEQLELKIQERTKQLVDAQDELVRKEKLATLGQLSGSVGHELRNPLGVINNAIYFLKTIMPDAPETVKEYLDMIKSEVDNSERIIADLLDFSRTKTPQIKIISVSEVVAQGLDKCSVPENIAAEFEIAEDLPSVRIDPFQMGQVFQNLLTNACQAMPEGGTLRISAGIVPCSKFEVQRFGEKNVEQGTLKVELQGDFVQISVTDTGEGITPGNLKKLFQPLFTTKARGIGLGLVVSKKLTEANGGRIEVETEPGRGTTFRVILPVGRDTI